MNLREMIINVLRDLGLYKRAIKDVEEWDGGAAQFDSTEDYCNACLINVNSGSPDEWTQENCKLPVRGPGDSSGTYVRQGVHAAAGGRGITQVEKPPDVDQGDWDAAVKKAANELISAYNEMDEVAPNSVYEIAGKEQPDMGRSLIDRLEEMVAFGVNTGFAHDNSDTDESSVVSVNYDKYGSHVIARVGDNMYKVPYTIHESGWIGHKEWVKIPSSRAVTLDDVYYLLYDAIMSAAAAGLIEGVSSDHVWLVDVYQSDMESYAVVSAKGNLYKIPYTINLDDSVSLGEYQQVIVEHSEIETPRGITVYRQSDGRHRWLALACTSILNRVGEIDSTALFDSFVAEIKRTGEYPDLDFFHVNGTDLGKADYVARSGYVLVASGLFENSKFGTAAAEALVRDSEYWGTSILYDSKSIPRLADFSGISIPVYDHGVLRKITILPETKAAAHFTVATTKRSIIMNGEVREALLKLFGGDEQLVDEFEQRVDSVDRAVEQGDVIARSSGVDGDQGKDAVETQGDDGLVVVRAYLEGLTDAVNTLTAELEKLVEHVSDLEQKTDDRIAPLERTLEQQKREWVSDLPEVRSFRQVVHRPRKIDDDGDSAAEPGTGEKVGERLGEKGLQP